MKEANTTIFTVAVVVAVVLFFNMPALPTPPTLTVDEMIQREADYLAPHLAECQVCLKEHVDKDYGPLVSYCHEYGRLIDRADRVGNWVAHFTRRSKVVQWEYVGRPIPGWKWSLIFQRWQQA